MRLNRTVALANQFLDGKDVCDFGRAAANMLAQEVIGFRPGVARRMFPELITRGAHEGVTGAVVPVEDVLFAKLGQ